MKIIRTINGKTIEIELTPEEIYKAHREQETRNTYDMVKSNMPLYLDGDEGELLINNKDFIRDITAEIQYQMDFRDITFCDALEEAIEKFKEDYLE